MKSLPVLIVALVLVAAAGSSAIGQTEPRPGVGDVSPGRPTLKRRQPAPDTPPTDEGRVDQESLEKDNRKQEDISADDSLDNQRPVSIEFEGLHDFSQADIVRAFCERRLELSKTQAPSPKVLAEAVAFIKELLEAHGYFHATVDTREDKEAGTIVFLVYVGQRLALAEVRFEGNRIFSSQELAAKMGEYLADYPEIQGGYDADIFDFCISRLLNFVRSRGYLQATLGQSRESGWHSGSKRLTKEIDGRGLVLIIPVDEGVLYRLGEIKIEGAEAVAPEIVRTMLTIRPGEIANGQEISRWLFEDLKRVYGEMGYIQYTAEPEPEFKVANGSPTGGVVDFKVTIDEGPQFRIRALEFRGSDLPEKELLALLRIHAGEVFNQQLFEESIDELNKLGRFELVDKDRDADFTTDEEQALINIVIKLKNRDNEVDSEKSLSKSRQP